MTYKPWRDTLVDVAVSGAVGGAATAAAAAACGARDSGSAIAAINAVSHILWGSDASNVRVADSKHTLPALVLNTGAVMFWSAIYERAFGHSLPLRRVGVPCILLPWSGASSSLTLAIIVAPTGGRTVRVS